MVELEYVGGPKDGEGTGIVAGALPLVFVHEGHRYVLTRDDTGALYYEWRGLIPELTHATAQAA